MDMGKLTNKDVSHVAKLSNLDLTQKEIEKYKNQLSKVISYVDELNKIDTSKVTPTAQTTGMVSITRPDIFDKKDCFSQGAAVGQGKNVKDGYFVVPMVLEEKTT